MRRPPKEPPPPCELELALEGRHDGEEVTLLARARNRSKRSLTLVLPDECAGGPVKFLGLGDRYDFYGGCNRGACVRGPGTMRVRLAPGESRVLARVTLRPGGDACNRPIPPGRHPVAFYLQFQETPPQVCGSPGWTLVQPEPAPAPPAPPPPSVPPPPPAPGRRCPPPIPCGLYCPHGFEVDSNGCGLCSCKESPLRRPPAGR